MFLMKKHQVKHYYCFCAPCYQTYDFNNKSFDALRLYLEPSQFALEIQGSLVALLELLVRGKTDLGRP